MFLELDRGDLGPLEEAASPAGESKGSSMTWSATPAGPVSGPPIQVTMR